MLQKLTHFRYLFYIRLYFRYILCNDRFGEMLNPQ